MSVQDLLITGFIRLNKVCKVYICALFLIVFQIFVIDFSQKKEIVLLQFDSFNIILRNLFDCF